MIKGKILWFFPLIFVLSLAFFYQSFTNYFFQDDWFVLNWVRKDNFLSLLSFRTDIIYWRPLAMPLFFAFSRSLFGLNPFGFHLIAFFIFFSLVISIYILFQLILKNFKMSLIGAFFYSIWPIHFISLNWLSTTAYVLSPLFQTLSFIFFIKFQKKRKITFFILSYFSFILALSSSEMALVLPGLFFLWGYFFRKKFSLKLLIPFLIIVLVYLLLRLVVFPLPARGDYQPNFDLKIINNFLWYILWAFNMPEKFKELIFFSRPLDSFKIIVSFLEIIAPTLLLILFIVLKTLQDFKRIDLKLFLFGASWFVLGLLPVIALTRHSFPMYLSFAGLGFILIFLNLFKNSKNLIILILIVLWVISSFLSIQFSMHNHWIANDQAISKAYSKYTMENVKSPQKNSTFIFYQADVYFAADNGFVLVDNEDQVRQSLNNNDAMQVLYESSTIKSLYPKENENLKISQDQAVYSIRPNLTK